MSFNLQLLLLIIRSEIKLSFEWLGLCLSSYYCIDISPNFIYIMDIRRAFQAYRKLCPVTLKETDSLIFIEEMNILALQNRLRIEDWLSLNKCQFTLLTFLITSCRLHVEVDIRCGVLGVSLSTVPMTSASFYVCFICYNLFLCFLYRLHNCYLPINQE